MDDIVAIFSKPKGGVTLDFITLCGIAIDAPFEFNESNHSSNEGNETSCGHFRI